MSDPDSGSGTTPADRPDLRVLQALRRIIRAVDLHSRSLAAAHAVTAPQLICLITVHEAGSLTVSELGRRVHLSPSTVVGILDRLEQKKLVMRQRSETDRRQVLVSATPQGQELAGNAPSPLQETLAHALKQLPDSEQAIIAASLERVVELMEVRDPDAAPILDLAPDLADQAPADD